MIVHPMGGMEVSAPFGYISSNLDLKIDIPDLFDDYGNIITNVLCTVRILMTGSLPTTFVDTDLAFELLKSKFLAIFGCNLLN